MARDVLKKELIGCAIEVVDADNKSLIGIKGTIIDETKNTIIIKDRNKKRKTLLKDQIRIIIEFKNRGIKIDGKKIKKRSEKRI